MNTVERIQNTFTDRFIASCARVSFGATADDYSDDKVKSLVTRCTKLKHVNPMFHPMITVRLPYGALDLSKLVQNKTLMAGLNLHEEDDTWIVTTSAWGLVTLAHHLGYSGYHSKIDTLCNVYNDTHNPHKQIMGFTPAPTPRHHQWFTFRFDTELATKAQLYTHTVGLAKSSQSFRYVDDIRFYKPHEWRGKADNVKQGSSDESVSELYVNYPITVNKVTHHLPLNYNDILLLANEWYVRNEHICNEQRRYILPQLQMSQYVITGTREAWGRVIGLRNKPDAQKEVRVLIEQVADLIASDKEWR